MGQIVDQCGGCSYEANYKANSDIGIVLNIAEEYVVAKDDPTAGIVVVDEVNGFCTAGCGNLAPVKDDPIINKMIDETDKLIRSMPNSPVLVLQDTHEADKPEPPYPPHCVRGTGEELIVPKLDWLSTRKNTYILKKDVINGFIGSMEHRDKYDSEDGIGDYAYTLCDELFFYGKKITSLIITGICTDICVMQFVQSVLSARNHGIFTTVKDIVVLVPAVSTYDLPLEATKQLGLPDSLAHPRELTHKMGLYFMQMSGAILTDKIVVK